MFYMFYSAISTLRTIFTVHSTLFIVSANRFHSWAHPVEREIHSSLFIGTFMAIHSLVLVQADKEYVSLILLLQFIAKYILKQVWKLRVRSLIQIKGIWQYKGNVLSCDSPSHFVVFKMF